MNERVARAIAIGFNVVAFAAVGVLVLFIAYTEGKNAGRDSEREHRADPSAYPKGSCKQQVLECDRIGGSYGLFRGDPQCTRMEVVKP